MVIVSTVQIGNRLSFLSTGGKAPQNDESHFFLRIGSVVNDLI